MLAPGILSQGPPRRGKPVVALSADIPLWQPVKMRWDKLDKRKPCGVIVRANYPSPGDGLSAQRMEGSCANLSVCLWIKVPCFPHGWAGKWLCVSLTFVWTVAESKFHCPLLVPHCPCPAPPHHLGREKKCSRLLATVLRKIQMAEAFPCLMFSQLLDQAVFFPLGWINCCGHLLWLQHLAMERPACAPADLHVSAVPLKRSKEKWVPSSRLRRSLKKLLLKLI